MLQRADYTEHLAAGARAKPGAERDQHDYERALYLLDDLERYVPCSYPPRPFELDGCIDAADVRRKVLNERGEYTACARVFGTFRARVTELEAISSKRLEMLVCTLRELRALAKRTGDFVDAQTLANINATEQRLSYHLRSFWQLREPEDDVSLREWAMRATREYLLLPADWRYV